MRDSARRVAAAIRMGARREHERRGPGRARATVLSTSPLTVDVHGSDLQLDSNQVTLARGLATAGIAVDDVLILVEVDDDEWVAIEAED